MNHSPNIHHQLQLSFIVGAPRSGTTLLMSILGTHTQIHCVAEFRFYLYYMQRYRKTDFSIKKNRAAIVNDLIYYITYRQRLNNILPEVLKIKQPMLQTFVEEGEGFDYLQAVKYLYLSLEAYQLQTPDPKIVIEKNPAYTQHISTILEHSPQSKFIGLVRNPRDVVSSNVNNTRRTPQDIHFYAKYWQLLNTELLKSSKQYPNKILLISYESLVKEMDATLKKCLTFLGIDKMLEPNKHCIYYAELFKKIQNATHLKHRERWLKKFGDLSKPVNPKYLGSWKKRLTLEQVADADHICRETAQALGIQLAPLVKDSSFKNNLAYQKAIIQHYANKHRFKLNPKLNLFMETLLRKLKIV